MMGLLGLTPILAAEDPSKTHSWIWPEGSEILWGTLSFLVVAYLLWKFGWPQITKMMHDRSARIQAQLDEAATAKQEAEEAAVAIRQAKGDIASERQRLLAEADEQAARLLADGRARLEQEVAELLAKAEAEIEAVPGRVLGELQTEVAQVASDATEQLVIEMLDDDLQQQLVEEFISRVGATTA